ncbi:MAG TPA: AraC family transcriptional regulator [Halioglobus sp.]
MLLLTLVAGYVVVEQSPIAYPLLPAEVSVYPWRSFAGTDTAHGGTSSMDVRESTYDLNFDFILSAASEYPYVTLGLTFDSMANPEKLVDWSQYSSIQLRIKCRPSNVLSFVLHTYEEQLTQFADITTFRPTIRFFSCGEEWQVVTVDLRSLDTAEWWLKQNNLNLAHQEYALARVRGFSIASSPQSSVGILSSVSIEEIILQGRDWPLIYTTITFGAAVWGSFLLWCCWPLLAGRKSASADPEAPSILYDPITTDSKRDRDKSAVLNYLASQYVNPELSVDTAVATLGVNRAKINDILREESGLTFSAYLNKLRLTEAARLIADKRMGVAEAAFAVGYGSVSYFNRVFKKAYGCPPSLYKGPSVTDSAADLPP